MENYILPVIIVIMLGFAYGIGSLPVDRAPESTRSHVSCPAVNAGRNTITLKEFWDIEERRWERRRALYAAQWEAERPLREWWDRTFRAMDAEDVALQRWADDGGPQP